MKLSKKIVIQSTTVFIIIVILFILKIIKNDNFGNSERITLEQDSFITESDLEITKFIDFEELKKQNLPIIIDFGADSCIPCKEMAPVLKELNYALRDKAIIRFVDVWKNNGLAKGIPLQVIPTQIFIDPTGNPYTPSPTINLPFKMYKDSNTGDHIFTVHIGGLTKEDILNILSDMGMN